MIAKEFPIKEYHFSVLSFSIDSIFPENPEDELGTLVVDIDFNLFESEDTEQHRIDILLNIYPEEKKPGYLIKMTSSGIFSIDEEYLDEDVNLDNCLIFTCLPMLIGNSRGFLMNVTSDGVFGKYTLPSISLEELIKSKEQ